MHVIDCRNVNDGYRAGMRLVAQEGILLPSRNGPVRRVSDPVCTKYQRPTERVLFDSKRDANPFFHLFEALWMLSGGDDVQTLDHVLKSFRTFSDNGRTFHGAYGYRWRHWPFYTTTYTKEIDQLAEVINLLRDDPTSRRAVIGMWDPARDLKTRSVDIPCNDAIKVAIVNGALDIQVFNRSNDIVYGCYGANAVHMSVLQEYLAAMIGVPVGRYFQISGDFHAYVESPYNWELYWPLLFDEDISWHEMDVAWVNNYEPNDDGGRDIGIEPLVSDPETFDQDNAVFIAALRTTGSVMHLDPQRFNNDFFGNIAMPMHWSFEYYKQGQFREAINNLENFRTFRDTDNDWLMAGQAWLERRAQKRGIDVRR